VFPVVIFPRNAYDQTYYQCDIVEVGYALARAS
jgi:hypothetical protein